MSSESKATSGKSSPSVRQRVIRACDRCRSKKSKCDGASPCGRCENYKEICVFRNHKKPQNKVYPKGYVEMLETEQALLIAGLQELYRRCLSGEKWSGSSVQSLPNGVPLVHDILNSLGALKHEIQVLSTNMGLDTDFDWEKFMQEVLANDATSFTDTTTYQGSNIEYGQVDGDSASSHRCSSSGNSEAIHSGDANTFSNFGGFLDQISSHNTLFQQTEDDTLQMSQSVTSFLQSQPQIMHHLWHANGFEFSGPFNFNTSNADSSFAPAFLQNASSSDTADVNSGWFQAGYQ